MQYIYPASIELLEWMGDAAGAEHRNHPPNSPVLGTLDIYVPVDETERPVKLIADDKDWIIKDSSGLFGRISPEVFAATYEEISDVHQDGRDQWVYYPQG
jgi:hypothetical protein